MDVSTLQTLAHMVTTEKTKRKHLFSVYHLLRIAHTMSTHTHTHIAQCTCHGTLQTVSLHQTLIPRFKSILKCSTWYAKLLSVLANISRSLWACLSLCVRVCVCVLLYFCVLLLFQFWMGLQQNRFAMIRRLEYLVEIVIKPAFLFDTCWLFLIHLFVQTCTISSLQLYNQPTRTHAAGIKFWSKLSHISECIETEFGKFKSCDHRLYYLPSTASQWMAAHETCNSNLI